jgi:hypothetical protein
MGGSGGCGGRPGRQRVRNALTLVIVPAVQNAEEIHVSNEGRLAAKGRLVARLDKLAAVETLLVRLPSFRVRIHEHIELGIA